jgi:hypothetical protein
LPSDRQLAQPRGTLFGQRFRYKGVYEKVLLIALLAASACVTWSEYDRQRPTPDNHL